jgi:hypothetical protein
LSERREPAVCSWDGYRSVVEQNLGFELPSLCRPTTAAAKPTIAVKLPKKYRHMTYDEFIAAGKEALRQLQERFEKTGRLIG